MHTLVFIGLIFSLEEEGDIYSSDAIVHFIFF